MKKLVKVENGQVVVSSREIALKFNKEDKKLKNELKRMRDM